MASRRDGFRAHRFATRRLREAVVAHRVDGAPAGLRRPGVAAVGSVALGVLSLVTMTVVAAVSPVAADWRRSDAVIVERETGARFVLLDGVLHAVPNYTSARLIIGAAAAPIAEADRRQLAEVPHGQPLGVPGAPDELPAPADLITGPWSVCSTVVPDPVAVVAVGASSVGAGLADGAILGRVASGDEYLIWHDHRLRIRHPAIVLAALGLAGASPAPLMSGFVDTLPASADLDTIRIAGVGSRSTMAGLRVGEVVTPGQEAGAETFAVVRRDGLAVISPVEAAILLNDPATPGPGVAVTIAKPVFAAAPHPSLPATGWPTIAPDLVDVASAACVSVGADGTPGAVSAGWRPAGSGIVVPPGRGVLVRTGESSCLLTEAGRCFPIADAQALVSLGYADASPVPLPATVLAMVPKGPMLSRAAAMHM
jgi:type VII secretion protein EccB